MNLKFDALLKNQTWVLLPSHLAHNIVGCKWVFCFSNTLMTPLNATKPA